MNRDDIERMLIVVIVGMLALVFVVAMIGCTTLTVTSPDGVEARYTNTLFDKDISGLSILKSPDGWIIETARIKSELEIAVEAFNMGIKKGSE